MCDNYNFIWRRFQRHSGKQPGSVREKKERFRVVLDLFYGLPAHSIICDNFFTSSYLCKMVLIKNIMVIDTMQTGKLYILIDILKTKCKEIYCLNFAFTKDRILVLILNLQIFVFQSTLYKSKKSLRKAFKENQRFLIITKLRDL